MLKVQTPVKAKLGRFAKGFSCIFNRVFTALDNLGVKQYFFLPVFGWCFPLYLYLLLEPGLDPPFGFSPWLWLKLYVSMWHHLFNN